MTTRSRGNGTSTVDHHAAGQSDALRDTLESRNASGALEQDDQVAAMGRLADFIHVEEGWEEAIAHALDAFSGAIVVPGGAQPPACAAQGEAGSSGQGRARDVRRG